MVNSLDLESSKNKSSTAVSREFVTFGLGKHLCTGRFFAVHEIKLALITLLRQYTITTVSGKQPLPVQYISGVIARNCLDPLKLTKKI